MARFGWDVQLAGWRVSGRRVPSRQGEEPPPEGLGGHDLLALPERLKKPVALLGSGSGRRPATSGPGW